MIYQAKREVNEFAQEQLQKWGLRRWRIVWGKAKKQLGLCVYDKELIRLSVVCLEAYGVEAMKNTVLHEIAHALAPGDGHGRIWRQWCEAVGADPSRLYDAGDAYKAIAKKHTKWTATCQNCGEVYKRMRYQRGFCPCGGELDWRDSAGNPPDYKYRIECPSCDYKLLSMSKPKDTNSACRRCCKRYNGGRWSAEFMFRLIKIG